MLTKINNATLKEIEHFLSGCPWCSGTLKMSLKNMFNRSTTPFLKEIEHVVYIFDPVYTVIRRYDESKNFSLDTYD